MLQCLAVCCSVLQYDAVCCSVLQCAWIVRSLLRMSPCFVGPFLRQKACEYMESAHRQKSPLHLQKRVLCIRKRALYICKRSLQKNRQLQRARRPGVASCFVCVYKLTHTHPHQHPHPHSGHTHSHSLTHLRILTHTCKQVFVETRLCIFTPTRAHPPIH